MPKEQIPTDNPNENKELSPQEIREKLKDPSYLPTHREIDRTFKSKDFISREWSDFCFDEQNPVFEFLNEEFLNAFSDYLSQRAKELGASEEAPITVLEVGAGNGRLTYFLQKKLEERLPGQVKVVASDSGKWGIKTAFPVDVIEHKEALKKYKPKIVVFSWMPYGEDYTADMRAETSVEEYLLIGETDGGCCGNEWETWGSSYGNDEEVPPYKADGFMRSDLEDLSSQQICRTDQPSQGYYHSSTVSFERKVPK